MTDARRQQVEALFRAALEKPPSERAAFVAAATGGDAALRREVESLLDSDDFAARATPPTAERVPSRDATRTAEPFESSRVGPYRVIALLGAGGMGEVFRARDDKLNRDVALKVLPRTFELDPDRLARFRREARVLAALNHPHIAAIYGLEESDGRQALVLELVEGVTLAKRIEQGPLPVPEALALARQVAEALQGAHEKGIIHRDLKPDNIKVTPAGIVKVLDFGLAKTAAPDLPETSPSPATSAAPEETRIGVVLGTAAYMSPEQARGEEVDARTDVWAFGCVLFEMLTGRRAFSAATAADARVGVLEQEPDWRLLPKHTPPTIHQLLRRCLQKDRRRRLQTIADARRVIEKLVGGRTLSRRARIAIAAGVVLALALGASVWSRLDRRPVASRSDWVQLTSLDSVTQPALSPDGRALAFIRGPSTFVSPGQLYVKLLPDGEPVALTNDSLPKMGPVFSPDGSRIAYTVNEGNSWDTWVVPTVRGEARRWLRNASGLTWFGGSDLMFAEIKTGIHMAIVRSTEGRDESRDLYLPPHVSGMAHRAHASPDGRWVLVVEMDERGGWLPCRLLPSDGGASHPVGPAHARCTNVAWTPDGRWMYFSADAGDGFHLWRQRFPDGPPEQVTSGPTEEEGIAIAPDGKWLITSVGLTQRSVWLNDGSNERQISLEGYAFWPLLSADGRTVCFRRTRAPGTGQAPSELWVADVASGQTQRLFPGRLVTGHDLSRDDRIVAAVVERDGKTGLWLAWLDGREPPRRIPHADGDNPRFGRDGEIVFRALEGNAGVLTRIRDDGEGRAPIAQLSGSVFGGVSPDGEWVSSVGPGISETSLYSTAGRGTLPFFPSSQSARLRWSPDGRWAYMSIQYGQAAGFAVGRTYVLPLAPGSVLPQIPSGGFRTEAEVAAVPGVQVLPHGDVALGPSASVYVYSRVTTTRNLYRIPLH